MASRSRQVLDAVRDALVTINGAGSYTHNLSGTDAVKIGRSRPEDTVLPAAWVAVATLRSEHGTGSGRYRRLLTVDIEARVSATSQTTEERACTALDLLDDIVTALEANRTMGGLIYDLILEGVDIDGDEIGMSNVGIVYAQVVLWWEVASGVGV